MRIGVHFAPCRSEAVAASTRAFARATDELGYHRVWACEPDTDTLDALTSLAFAAALTEQVSLGVVVLADRWPAPQLARSLATLADLSDGRLTAGLDVTGDPMPLLEQVSSEASGGMPVLLTAAGPSDLARIANDAHGWLVDERTPIDALAPGLATIRDRAARSGRDPDTLSLVARARVRLTSGPAARHRPLYEGTAEQVAADLDALRRAGVDETVLIVADHCGLDATLDAFAALAEAMEIASANEIRGTRPA